MAIKYENFLKNADGFQSANLASYDSFGVKLASIWARLKKYDERSPISIDISIKTWVSLRWSHSTAYTDDILMASTKIIELSSSVAFERQSRLPFLWEWHSWACVRNLKKIEEIVVEVCQNVVMQFQVW